MKNTEKNPFIAPLTRKEFDPAETLKSIRKLLEDNNFNDPGDTFSDKIHLQHITFDAIISNILYELSDDESEPTEGHFKDLLHGLQLNWYKLDRMIKAREDEHTRVYSLAFHGVEETEKGA